MLLRIKNESDIEFGLEQLSKLDPKLQKIINIVDHVPLRLSKPGYSGLAQIITSQLISRAAANAIWLRLETGLGGVSVQKVLTKNEDELMAMGLSRAKAKTFLLIAKLSSDGLFSFDEISTLPVDKALKELMSLKGIGRWSAEVYLMFCCGHPDFFPAGDIALRTAAGHAIFEGDQPDEKTLRVYSERWSPYRSIAARLLWRHYALLKNSDTNPL